MAVLGYGDIKYRAIGLKKMADDIAKSERAFKMSTKTFAAGAAAIGAAVAATSAAIVKIGVPFEQMMVDAGAAARATQKELSAMEAAARKAGATTEHTATQAAESLKFLAKAGLDAQTAVKALPGMLDFKTAIGSLMSLGQATDFVTDAMTSMGLGVEDLTTLTNQFIAVSNRSSTDSAQLQQAWSNVAGVARVYGADVTELNSLLAIQASQGIKAGKAGRQLKNVYANTSKAAAELGIENKGLIPTLQAVADAGWEADKIMSVFGKIAMPSVAAILQKVSGTGPGSFDWFTKELTHASEGMGETAIQAEKMRQTVGNQFKVVVSMVEDIALSIFEKWKPSMMDGIKTTQNFFVENKKAIVSVSEILLPLLERTGQALLIGAEIGVGAIDFINASMIGLADISNRTFIEIEHAGKVAWAAIQSSFAIVIGEMMKSFDAFLELGEKTADFLGMDEMSAGFAAMSEGIKTGIKDMSDLAGEMDKAVIAREKALEQHENTINAMIRERQGYTETTEAARKSAEEKLALIRSSVGQSEISTKKQIEDLQKISDAEIAALDERLKAQEEVFRKTGFLGEELYKKKLADIDSFVTRMRMANADEIFIQQEKNKRIAELDAARHGQTVKDIRKTTRAIEKENDKRIKDAERRLKETEKLESQQFKDFEKNAKQAQKAYEKFIKDQLGIKEISVESQKELDEQYAQIFAAVQEGNVDSFDEATTAMLSGKEEQIQNLIDQDTLYGEIFRREQDLLAESVRRDFYDRTGIFSEEFNQKRISEIEAQTQKWIDAGVSVVDAEREKNRQLAELDIQKLESQEDFLSGVQLALKQSEQDFTTWADVGLTAYNALESGMAEGFSDLANNILKGDFENMGRTFEDVLGNMLDAVIDTIAQMAAEWAASQLASIAIQGVSAVGSWLTARDGQFNIPTGQPGQIGDAIPVIAHVGESILTADQTQGLMNFFGISSAAGTQADWNAINAEIEGGQGGGEFDKWIAGIKESMGFSEGGEASEFIQNAGAYGAAGQSFLNAWQAFESGNDVQGAAYVAQGIGQGLEAYGNQSGDINLVGQGQGMMGAAGAALSAYNAYQAFESGDTATALMQTLQTVQQGYDAYAAYTAYQAGSTAVEAGTGAVATTGGTTALGDIVAGAGYGGAIWTVLSMLSGGSRLASEEASVGRTVGSVAGAVAGSYVPAVGTAVGGFVGAGIGTFVGGLFADSPETFTLTEAAPHVNAIRPWEAGQGMGIIPPPGGFGAYNEVLEMLFEGLNRHAVVVNDIGGAILADFSPGQSEAFNDYMEKLMLYTPVDEHWRFPKAPMVTSGQSNYLWNDAADVLSNAILMTQRDSIVPPEQNNMLNEVVNWIQENKAPPEYIMNPNEYSPAHQEMVGFWTAEARLSRAQEEGPRGAATGGFILPPGEDGFVGVRAGEFIVNERGDNIRVAGPGSAEMLAELKRQNELVKEQNELLMEQNQLLYDIRSKPTGITPEAAVAEIYEPLVEFNNNMGNELGA